MRKFCEILKEYKYNDRIIEDIDDILNMKTKEYNNQFVNNYMIKDKPKTEDLKKYYINKKWKINREIVLERDKYKCVICSNKKKIHVHHVDKDRLNNEIYNLLTLCAKCHMKIHAIKKKL